VSKFGPPTLIIDLAKPALYDQLLIYIHVEIVNSPPSNSDGNLSDVIVIGLLGSIFADVVEVIRG
jgi:hypothetical protein